MRFVFCLSWCFSFSDIIVPMIFLSVVKAAKQATGKKMQITDSEFRVFLRIIPEPGGTLRSRVPNAQEVMFNYRQC